MYVDGEENKGRREEKEQKANLSGEQKMCYLFIYVRRDLNSGTLSKIYGYEELMKFLSKSLARTGTVVLNSETEYISQSNFPSAEKA